MHSLQRSGYCPHPKQRSAVSLPSAVTRLIPWRVNFTGTAPWTFTYTDGNVVTTKSGITSSPYTWVVPVTPTVVTRTLAITAIKDFACNSIDTAYFVQKINELPVGQIVSLHGIYICNNTTDTLFVSSPDSLGYQWTYNATPVPGLISDSISTLTPGSYNAILTNRFGCIDTAATPVTLHYVKQPVVQFVYDSYCINNIIHFTNTTDTVGIGMTQWSWDFGDGNTANTLHSTDTYLKGGKHHVKLTAFQLYCPAYSTSADSTLDIQFPIPALRLPSVSAYKNQSTPLTGRNIANYKYQWLPSKGIDVPTSSSPNFNLQTTQDYIINLISPAGCITPDSMLVRVFDDQLLNIMVPKSFTPNGDGINDVLYPYLAGIKTFQYFKVFNRFGKLLFQTTNPDAGWNGMFNGVQQPMGIYIWVATGIANDGTPVEKRGETLLLR
jgi:gliding motility-associated-like protein